MLLNRNALSLYAVTDSHHLEKTMADGSVKKFTLLEEIEQALEGGITMLQLREKSISLDKLEEEAIEAQKLCRKYNVPFILDDNVPLAVKIGADGVHVGQSDMEASKVREIIGHDMILGVTARNAVEAKAAEIAGADYLGSGALFITGTKSDAKPMSKDTLRSICESVHIPVVAIGGITSQNVSKLAGEKIAGVAVSEGIFAANDITKETDKLKKLISEL